MLLGEDAVEVVEAAGIAFPPFTVRKVSSIYSRISWRSVYSRRSRSLIPSSEACRSRPPPHPPRRSSAGVRSL